MMIANMPDNGREHRERVRRYEAELRRMRETHDVFISALRKVADILLMLVIGVLAYLLTKSFIWGPS